MKIAARIPAFGLVALLALTSPAMAQGHDDSASAMSPLERGIMLLMDNLFSTIAPELEQVEDGMSGIVARLGPALADLAVLVDDIRNYQTPERLENGDILIRRSPDAPPPPPIGDNLRDLARPDSQADKTPLPPVADPAQPEIEL